GRSSTAPSVRRGPCALFMSTLEWCSPSDATVNAVRRPRPRSSGDRGSARPSAARTAHGLLSDSPMPATRATRRANASPPQVSSDGDRNESLPQRRRLLAAGGLATLVTVALQLTACVDVGAIVPRPAVALPPSDEGLRLVLAPSVNDNGGRLGTG